MLPDTRLLEVLEFQGAGYKPLKAFEAWRVAVLNSNPELRTDHLNKMQRHDLTDEVFVLLKGRCLLFLGEGEDSIERIYSVEMIPGKVYNVRKGCWHTHSLAPGTQVLIVENDNTASVNSPSIKLTSAQTDEIIALIQSLWA